MDPVAAVLFEALRERGDAPFFEHAGLTRSGAALATAMQGAPALVGDLPVALTPGDVVALRGSNPAIELAAPLLAWSLGLCTHHVGARETRSSVDGLLAASGARMLLTWEPPGMFGGLPLATAREERMPTGTLLATSGSSGRPKLVLHSLGKHLESARAANVFLDLGPRDRLLLSLPTWHVGGLSLLFRAILSGAMLCLPNPDESLGAALTRCAPTQVSLVATQLKRLLDGEAGLAGLRACRAVVLGGGPAPAALRARALDAGVPLVASYGATETAAFVVASADPDVVRREDTGGSPLPGRDVVVSPDGEICIGGPTLLDGYLQPHGLVAGVDAEGRWCSGDLGHMVDGTLYIRGRADRMFVSGGENIQPEAIEEALLAIPAVAEAVVVPVPHAEYGLRPVAFVAGEAACATALETALRAVLPGFMAPQAYYRLPEPPSGQLKPDLRTLTALASDELAASGLAQLPD